MITRFYTLNYYKSLFLFGPRQCGKSTLIKSTLPGPSITINLLHHKTFLSYAKDPSLFREHVLEALKTKKIEWVFVDEIQRVPELLNEIHAFIEDQNIKFVISGSSIRKLKRNQANMLGGRALTHHLFPFIYVEIKPYFNLEKILQWGSIPGIFFEPDGIKKRSLNSYSQTYLKEEIAQEGLVRNVGAFAQFLDIAASQFTEILSYVNIARECHISEKTVAAYYQILEETLVGFKLSAWAHSVKKQLTSHPKFYFFDNGVCNSINRQLAEPPAPLLRGKLFEQWLINEIKCYLAYKDSDCQIFYWRTNHGQEVDLIIAQKGTPLAAIEFKASKNIGPQHLGGLRSFAEEYPKCQCLLVAEVERPYEMELGLPVPTAAEVLKAMTKSAETELNRYRSVKVLPWSLFLEEYLPKLCPT